MDHHPPSPRQKLHSSADAKHSLKRRLRGTSANVFAYPLVLHVVRPDGGAAPHAHLGSHGHQQTARVTVARLSPVAHQRAPHLRHLRRPPESAARPRIRFVPIRPTATQSRKAAQTLRRIFEAHEYDAWFWLYVRRQRPWWVVRRWKQDGSRTSLKGASF